jgi:hypothetical protein
MYKRKILVSSVHLRTLAAGLVFVFIISACGPSDADFTEFSKYSSPDGKQYVVIDSAHSVLAFGPETLRIYVSEGDNSSPTLVVTTKIANDGTGISEKNITADWISRDILSLCLRGVEQEDHILEINIREVSYVEKSQNC